MLLDEPLGALDKKLREQMQLELRQIQKSVGVTFVFVTHDQEEALTMSDRIAVMAEGKILEVGSPDELYERPQTRFVADFLGTMNVFEGCVKGRDGDSYIVDTRGLGQLRADVGKQEFSSGEKVSVALRPENLKILESQAGVAGSVNGILHDTAYLGDRAQIYVKLKDSDQSLLISVQNLDGAASAATHGERDRNITIGWSKSSILLLKDNLN